MFWTDWGRNPRIERASMDGKLRTVIVSTKLYWPNGLTIDYPNNLLYFADAYLDFIDYCDFNGNNRKQVLASDLVSVWEEKHIFWIICRDVIYIDYIQLKSTFHFLLNSMCKTLFFLLLLSVKRYCNIPTQLPFLRILCIGPTDTSTVWCEPISGTGRTRQWCFSTSLSPWVWWQCTQPGSRQVWQDVLSTSTCGISITAYVYHCVGDLNWFGRYLTLLW